MKIKAYAKINITLDIPKIREDGYHELCSVFQTVSLHDELEIQISESDKNEIVLTCDTPNVPCDERNLCWKAVAVFTEKYGIKNKKISIELKKNIPSGAGLGGGSSDCAETLKALNKLLEVNASNEELEKIGVKLGADVPFFIKGGTQLAEGIGEKLTELKLPYPETSLVILKPEAELPTVNIYKIFDNLPKESLPEASTEKFLAEISKGDINSFKLITNMLEPAAKTLCPEIEEVEKFLLEKGAVSSMMTGSGSAVFGIFTNVNKAAEALEAAKHNKKIIFGTMCRFI
ncbi:MAG: 4-(cytidine 5'-diphospho)-2-C-methyl-D-erythritol kinase [Oscillospiraceae bacterium]|nr:4-(cytidine 5'-diphospho)-2-C-methyl-D-erythritol kinase [Oscillospiraceae bacterium]